MCGVAEGPQEANVVAEAAPVVEESALRRQDPVADQQLHRPREVGARYRCSVAAYYHLSLLHSVGPVAQFVIMDRQTAPFKLRLPSSLVPDD